MPSLTRPRWLLPALGWAVVAASLLLGAFLRFSGLETRPMHLDEAVQAYKLGELLERGDYLYDRTDFHGPVLLYSTLPWAWLRGVRTFAGLEERLLRSVPAWYGLGLLALIAASAPALGRAAPLAALLAAVSTPLVFYSRYYIMEMPMVFYLGAALWALHAYLKRPGWLPALLFGSCGGIVHATKETGAISFLAMALALGVLALLRLRQGIPWRPEGFRWAHWGAALGAGLFVSAALFSVGFQRPQAIVDSVTTYFSYLQGRPGGEEHHKPFLYYLQTLAWRRSEGVSWTEGMVLLLALAGLVLCWTPAGGRAGNPWVYRFLTLYALCSALVYSAIPYKTPWSLLPWFVPLIVLAAYAAATLISVGPKAVRVALGLAVGAALLAGQLREIRQTRQAITLYAADNRNPYVYGHTTANLLRLADRIDALRRLHPKGYALPIRVYDAEGWPLPWYLRRYTDVAYAAAVPEQPSPADIYIVTTRDEQRLLPAIEGTHSVDNYYGLRHEYLITMFVENRLWERFLGAGSSALRP